MPATREFKRRSAKGASDGVDRIKVVMESAEYDTGLFVMAILQQVREYVLLGLIDLQEWTGLAGLDIGIFARPAGGELLQPEEPRQGIAGRNPPGADFGSEFVDRARATQARGTDGSNRTAR
jgi:hypothetical protein